MRTRSSRFFVILLHLVGVCHHTHKRGFRSLFFFFYSNGEGGPSSGILAVHPFQVQLESVSLSSYPSATASTTSTGPSSQKGSERGVVNQEQEEEEDAILINNKADNEPEPIWLQDQEDSLCLGPTGKFMECGDATLFYVRKEKLPNVVPANEKRLFLSGLFGGEQRQDVISSDSDNSQAIIKPVAGWTFQVVDEDVFAHAEDEDEPQSAALKKKKRNKQRLRRARNSECLDATRSDETAAATTTSSSSVFVQQCPRRSWGNRLPNSGVWLIEPNGVLQTYEKPGAAARRRRRNRNNNKRKGKSTTAPASKIERGEDDAETEDDDSPLCLYRGKGKEATLAPCRTTAEKGDGSRGEDGLDSDSSHQNQTAPVRFTFVRYRAVTVPANTAAAASSSSPGKTAVDEEEGQQRAGRTASARKAAVPRTETRNAAASASALATSASASSSSPLPPSRTAFVGASGSSSGSDSTATTTKIPSTRDKAHSQASEPPLHAELKLSSKSSQPLSPKATHHHQHDKAHSNKKPASPFALLKDSHPILLAGNNLAGRDSSTSSSTAAIKNKGASTTNLISHVVRKIRVHPYIDKATNEVWTDPQTGLEFRTDLCRYLGHNRKEHGRHTLMGVGQYRKGYVVKVYGIGFYVSKRDALADPAFQDYASLSAEELRKRDDFYIQLRSPQLTVERTIMIKTNMQLASDTMRASLQVEWELLSDEAKELLAASSLAPRDADEEMLRIIQSPENPSRCSCSQRAPPEYNANPDCCARGTELVFTWTKNGDLELRLNKRVMEVFERPDIAEGIFYEYLRTDDPMSTDLIERVVDGFPFLLAPLDQVKGVNLGKQQQQSGHAHKETPGNPILHAIGGFADSVSSQAGMLAGMMQRSAAEAATNAGNAARSFGDAAQKFAKEIAHPRHAVRSLGDAAHGFAKDMREGFLHPKETIRSLGDAAHGFADQILHPRKTARELGEAAQHFAERMLQHGGKQAPGPSFILSPSAVTEWVERNISAAHEPARRTPYGRVFGYPLSRWFGDTYYEAIDEIGPMKRRPSMSTTRKVFLALVHLYLLLLFIVSFPGSYSTRTKLVMRRSLSRSFSSMSSASSSMLDDSSLEDEKPTSRERLHCKEQGFSRGRLLSRARQSLPQEVNLKATATGPPLKKKSFSYCL